MLKKPSKKTKSSEAKKKKNGITKPRAKVAHNYDEAKVQQALLEVANGMSLRKAAETFGVPKSTLFFRKSPHFKKIGFGPRPVLSDEEEQKICNWIFECSRKGFPRRSLDLLKTVETFLIENPRPNPFKDNKPGKSWLAAFLKRHQEIATRTSEAVTAASATVAKDNIIKWFQSVEELLKEENVVDILSEPSRVFNGDETNFLLWPKPGKVFAKKGAKNVYEVDGGLAKSSLTVMFTFSAGGETVPPMIVYPYIRLPKEIAFSVPDGWSIGTSETGWMNSAVFFEYIANTFNDYLTRSNIERPVILFVDGHRSHLTYQLRDLCEQLRIILICLYPNATRILQPADVAAFKPLKDGWKKCVLEWRHQNINKMISKKDFAPLLKHTVDRHIKKTTLMNGFRASGLYPWNYENIDFSKCLGANNSTKETFVEESLPSSHLTYEEFKSFLGPRLWRAIDERDFESDGDDDFNKALQEAVSSMNMHFKNAEPRTRENPIHASSQPLQADVDTAPNAEIVYHEELNEGDSQTIHDPGTPSSAQITAQPNAPPRTRENPFDGCSQPVEPDLNIAPSAVITYREELDEGDSQTIDDPRTPPNAQISAQPNAPLSRSTNEQAECLADIKNYSIKTMAVNSLDSCLIYPDTPKRKGVRHTRRFPFVLTSAAWKRTFLEEEEKKNKIQREKADRAEQKKIAKDQKAKKKPLKKRRKRKNSTSNQESTSLQEAHQPDDSSIQVVQVISRQLTFSGSEDEEDRNQLAIPASPTRAFSYEEEDDECFSGVCRECSSDIGRSNPGKRCDICENKYHLCCLPQSPIVNEIVTCHECLKEVENSETLDFDLLQY